jgi:general secretion pathway protein G
MNRTRATRWILGLAVAGASACGGCIDPDAAYAAARETQARADLKRFSVALETYRMQRERYPSTEAGLKALVEDGMIESLKPDPWGHPYGYRLDAGGEGYVLACAGPDGREGTKDDITRRGPEAGAGGGDPGVDGR